jgi:hypothetical protein
MSRGPGRIERALRALFDANPDKAFTTDDLCLACYPDIACQRFARALIKHKHRVAVGRAAANVLTGDPNWRSRYSLSHGRMWVYLNAASVTCTAMTVWAGRRTRTEWVEERARQTLEASIPFEQQIKANVERRVREHIVLRDATPPRHASNWPRSSRESASAQPTRGRHHRRKCCLCSLRKHAQHIPSLLPRPAPWWSRTTPT